MFAKHHFWKWYLGIGAVWGAYNLYTYASTRELLPAIKVTLLWPLDMYQTFSSIASKTDPQLKAVA